MTRDLSPPGDRVMRAAVVGMGNVAVEHLAALARLEDVVVAGVCDTSPAIAEAAAERHGIEAWYSGHEELLARARPDVVHVTTPPGAHVEVARDALAAGAHVIVEKPAAPTVEELATLLDAAGTAGRLLVEDHNYVFNAPVLAIAALRDAGDLGDVVHVDVGVGLEVAPGAAPGLRGGIVHDFLPHLASLAHAFAGPHRAVHARWPGASDRELRALVEGERASATLLFSASARPDAFWLRVHGTRLRATAGLFEPRLVIERGGRLPRPLQPVRNGLAEARASGRAAVGNLARKLRGEAVAYDGLRELVARTYAAARGEGAPPRTPEDLLAVARLVADVLAQGPDA